jgi:hypothetical protein
LEYSQMTSSTLTHSDFKEMIEKGEIGIVSGTHDITTGEVAFLADTMIFK